MSQPPFSMFSNAQVGSIPAYRITEICIAINANISNAEQVMFRLLKWGQMEIAYHRTNGPREPLRIMMDTLRQRSSCLAVCLNPSEHFLREICCPIGIFYNNIIDLCPVAAQILSRPEVQQEVLQSVNHVLTPNYPLRHPSGHSSSGQSSCSSDQHSLYSTIDYLSSQRITPLSNWSCFNQSERPNVLLFECIEPDEFTGETTSITINFLKKLNDRFILCSVPQLQDSSNEAFSDWQNFLSDQIRTSADCMIILVTRGFLKFQERLHEVMLNESTISIDEKRMLCVWTKFMQHQEETGSSLFFVGMSRDIYNRSRRFSTSIFRIPKETKKLTRMIKHSIK